MCICVQLGEKLGALDVAGVYLGIVDVYECVDKTTIFSADIWTVQNGFVFVLRMSGWCKLPQHNHVDKVNCVLMNELGV